MISIRKQIDDAEHYSARFQAMLKAFLGLTTAIPKTILDPDFTAQSKKALDDAAARISSDAPVRVIEETGVAVAQQIEGIARSNKSAMQERDAALKEAVSTIAGAISTFRSHGEHHKSNFTKLADGFEALSRVEDAGELRRRLRDNVSKLRQSVEDMRRESEESARRLDSQVTNFQQRLDSARKQSDLDNLTGLGSRRAAERNLQRIHKINGSVCVVLFDIEGFKEINRRYGTPFGDKILRALAHLLKDRFPEPDSLFRWGADEFLAIEEGSLHICQSRSRAICQAFSEGAYYTVEAGGSMPVRAMVVSGIAQYTRGESMEELYRRCRESLDRSRSELLK